MNSIADSTSEVKLVSESVAVATDVRVICSSVFPSLSHSRRTFRSSELDVPSPWV